MNAITPLQQALIVEDDPEIARLLQFHLRDIGFQATPAASIAGALRLFAERDWDLLILDLTLPDGDGIELCRRLRRAERPYLPILMLTARGAESERVRGLDSGADDYLSKPFGLPELLARVKALRRRVEALRRRPVDRHPDRGDASERLCHGELRLDIGKREVRLGAREIALTAKEFDLLAHFARHPGRVFSRPQLLDQVWGYGHDGYEHTVNSHINRLRGKIERDPAEPHYVLTVWGVGYKLNERC